MTAREPLNMPFTPPIRLAIVGTGARGSNYARLALASGRAVISAIAEPNSAQRERFLAEFGDPAIAIYHDWTDLAAQSRLADAVVIATPDRMHTEPAIAFAEAGYDILLEKPMAPTDDETTRIVEAVERNHVILAVAHVMRYSTYTRTLKSMLDQRTIGDIVSIEHLEPIGWWHFAHSYVRGNWARESSSNSMLMAKSSHDIDWISYIVGKPVRSISSYGGLYHFTPSNKPRDATDRCWTCPLKDTCAYSATTIYPRFLGDPVHERWPLEVLTNDVSVAGIDEALRTGPYGECVYNGQNDVADHQVVNFEFADGATASFTVTAFSALDFRQTRIFGTTGSIEGDGRSLRLHDFVTDTITTIDASLSGGASAADGHGGADSELIDAFLQAVAAHDAALLSSGARESLATHRLVWSAEESRRSGRTVILSPAVDLDLSR